MLTKKKCKEALEQLDLNCWGCEYACDMSDDKPCVLKEIIGKLIDEHFDNPPLKIEEIKKGMWVWDNKYECYAKIFAINEYKGTTYIDFNDYYSERYAENRFYRKLAE